jgi:predicted SnoaL-like aldol condensation-catalyzing enzyme
MQDDEEKRKTNKAVVLRFNTEVIERGNEVAFREIVSGAFVNRSAPPGMPAGPDSMLYVFNGLLRPAFPDMQVEIHDQIAEGDKVTTRKTIHATHLGEIFRIPATKKRVAIDVIDVVRIEGGRYVEHWGVNTLSDVIASLKA